LHVGRHYWLRSSAFKEVLLNMLSFTWVARFIPIHLLLHLPVGIVEKIYVSCCLDSGDSDPDSNLRKITVV
jgi:hypothetical protein